MSHLHWHRGQYSSTHDKTKLQGILSITQEVNQKAARATALASQQQYASQGLAGQRSFFSRYASQQCSIRACEMLLQTADLYAKDDDKSVAKGLYRELIVTYTAPIFKSYVKKAEFGLEDLK